MLVVTLKGVLAHKLRVLLTALSIALSVAFVAGTLVLSESLTSSFAAAYESQYAGVDVAVRSETAFADSEAADQRRPLPADLLDAVRTVPGVASAEGFVTGPATMIGPDGATLGAGARSNTGMSAPSGPGVGDVEYASGRAPAGADEVAIDAAAAESGQVATGDRIRVLTQGVPREFTVVGIARFGGADRLGATTTALFDLATAQEVLGRSGQYDAVRVVAEDGVSSASLAQRLGSVVPAGVEAVTARAAVDEESALVAESLGFLSTFLLVFAAVAVFVASFIIWNTFTILVAQRSRELALLRAIGATRRQVRRSVLGEALVVGLVASLAGLVLGAGVARALVLLMQQVGGVEMPYPALLPSPRTVGISLLVGTLVTLVASLAPARRATLVAPVEALREAVAGSAHPSGRRAVAGAALLVLGTGLLVAGLYAGSGVATVGAGALVTFVGVTVLLPLLARVLARVLGAPVARFGGTTGRLARENAMRNPNRTASTAAALMVGLALVVTVSVLASSLQASIGTKIDDTVRADLVVQQVDGRGAGLSPQLASEVRQVPGVDVVAEFAYGRVRVDGQDTFVAPVDPATVEDVLDLGVADGSVRGLSDGGVLVHEDAAQAAGWEVGSTVPVSWASTGDAPMVVAGTFRESDAVGADYLVSLDTYDEHATGRLDSMVLLQVAADGDVEQVQRAVVAAVEEYVTAEVLTGAQWKESISGQVDEMLVMVTALLLLAVFIALMGIVNTLALSVFERTRELGLLRAVGMTRRQVRRTVRWESVLIALIGAVTGSAVGLAFGVALVSAMDGEGVTELAVPVPRLAVYVAAAAAAGVLAALGPARRAARVDVLRAVVTD